MTYEGKEAAEEIHEIRMQLMDSAQKVLKPLQQAALFAYQKRSTELTLALLSDAFEEAEKLKEAVDDVITKLDGIVVEESEENDD